MSAQRRPIMVRRGGTPSGGEPAKVRAPGERVEGTVKSIEDGDVVLALPDDRVGMIDGSEFPEPPAAGATLAATFVQRDGRRKADILTLREPLKDTPWDKLKVGDLVSGTVVEVNTGGLVLNVGGKRGFMPSSQVGKGLSKSLASLLRKDVAGEVTRIDSRKKEVVLGLRPILDRWQQKTKARQYENFERGQIIEGKVVRKNEHGAFIDVGGVDGLLHASKISRHDENAETALVCDPGTVIKVEISYVDTERNRIGLDLPQERKPRTTTSSSPSRSAPRGALAEFELGEEVTGMVRAVESGGARILLDERIEGWLPRALFGDGELPRKGAVVKAIVAGYGPRRVELKPTEEGIGPKTWSPFEDASVPE